MFYFSILCASAILVYNLLVFVEAPTNITELYAVYMKYFFFAIHGECNVYCLFAVDYDNFKLIFSFVNAHLKTNLKTIF